MTYLTYLWEQFKNSSVLIKFTILAVLMIWAVAFGMAMFALFLLWERPAVAQPVTPSPVAGSPMITLNPTAGAANTPLTISGQGWTPGDTVLIYLTSTAEGSSAMGELAVESAVIDPTGKFIAVVPLVTQPNWSIPGLVRVVVRTVEGDVTSQAFFSLMDASAVPTETVTATPVTPTTPEPGASPTPTPEAPTATPQPGTPQLTTVTDLNIRSGPGTGYPILGLLRANQSAEITGVSPDGRWWQINFSGTNDGRGWVAGQYVTAANTTNVPVVQSFPSLPTATPQPTAPRPPASTPVVITDWRGEYYNNVSMSGNPIVVRNDTNIDFNWGKGSPANGVGSDNFSARWTRSVYFPAGTYRFTVRADDGVLFWIDDRLIIDQWHDSSTTNYTADVNLAEGTHSLKMAYYERVGDAVIQLRWERLNTYTDWKAEYYSNPNLSGSPALVRNDRDISFNWGEKAPASGLPADNFSVRWTRDVYFPAGPYRFTVRVDDGARLWVDGNLVIDQWRDSSTTSYSVDVNLSEGSHPVRLEYYDHWYAAVAQLDWKRVESYPDWKAEYFNNRRLEGNPVLVRNEDEIDHNWGDNAPASQVPADNFSARWTRRVEFDNATYLFEVEVDDGVRLWLDDILLIDSWEDGSARTLQGRLKVKDGQRRVKVEYYDRTGDAQIELAWRKDDSPANRPPQAIPGGPYTVNEGQEFTLNGRASYDPDGSIVRYEWDWSYDGSAFNPKAEGATVTHRYGNGPATRSIALRVTDNHGISRMETTWVRIENAVPVVDANGPYTTQVGRDVTFTGTARDTSADEKAGLTYSWDFGDGSPKASGSVASHIYEQRGTYTVRLTVTDRDGGQGTDTTTVEVAEVANQRPQAVIDGPKRGRPEDPLQFSGGNSSDSDGRVVSYAWNFGDNTNAEGVNVIHAFRSAGVYEVTLTVQDDRGKTDSATMRVNIERPAPANQPPAAVIKGRRQGGIGESLNFRANESTDSDGKIVEYRWDFGDGSQVKGARVSHTFNQAGTYPVTLTVTDNGGLSDSKTINVTIEASSTPSNMPPSALINGPATGGVGQALTFIGSGSTDQDGQLLGFTWDMGDGSNPFTSVDVTHSYAASGTYTVSLTVLDSGGITNTMKTEVTIEDGAPAVGRPGHEDARAR